MPITFELPLQIEDSLRRSLGDLNQAAKEAALVELYRQDKLTRCELSQALGISRMETEALLKRHNVTEDLPSADEIEEDINTLRRMFAG